MTIRNSLNSLLKAIGENLNATKQEDLELFIRTLTGTYNEGRIVGVVGAGRSGLVAKAFAMRLMHLGFNVFVIGETITPALGEGDVLLAVSGSGNTAITVSSARVAKQVGAKVVSITSFANSDLAKLSDVVLVVPGRIERSGTEDYFSRQLLGVHEPLAPMGTLFESSVSILLDSMIVELMRSLKISESDMMSKHSTVQ